MNCSLRHPFRILLALLTALELFAWGGSVAAATSTPAWPWDETALQPFWRSSTMVGETVLFIQDPQGDTALASLLFEPLTLVRVSNAAGTLTYEEGRDFLWKPGSRVLTLPAGSRIVSKKAADLRRPAGSQPYRLTHRDGQGEILFGASHEYHDIQTRVSYTHKPVDWATVVRPSETNALPKTRSRLQQRQRLKVALLGDSISTGCNASGWAGVAPHQPAYQDLFVSQLQRIFHSEVTLTNLAVGGTDTSWGLTRVDALAANRPDLILLAFGMNDAAGRSAAEYQANMRAMVDKLGARCPDAEFILIAPMLGNKDWVILHAELFPQYRNALAALCRPGVALADMTTLWARLLENKKDWDLTGNGVNHPNDFGHRVYAQVLSSLLIP